MAVLKAPRFLAIVSREAQGLLKAEGQICPRFNLSNIKEPRKRVKTLMEEPLGCQEGDIVFLPALPQLFCREGLLR